MPYRFLEDIATADVAFEACGASREELFSQCAEALLATMTALPGDINREVAQRVRLDDEQLDLLLFRFLGELVYYKDARRWLLHADDLTIAEHDGMFRLEGTLRGEGIAVARHRLLVDVKAVTLHRFRVIHEAGEWRATVVLDV